MNDEINQYCPRCGSADCTDPDSKGCSDNCIRLWRNKLLEVYQTIARQKAKHYVSSPIYNELDDLQHYVQTLYILRP